jgi:hypothetical protein
MSSLIFDVFNGPGTHRDVVSNGKVGAVRGQFRPSKSRATNTPITIKHADGTAKLTLDQRTEIAPFNFVLVDEYKFNAGEAGFVELTNQGADGRIAIDAVRWIWLGE